MIGFNGYSQSRDLANVGYIYIGDGSVGDKTKIGFEKFYTSVTYPIKVKKGAIFNSVKYSSVHIDYSNIPDLEDVTNNLTDFYTVSYSLGYFRVLSPKWKMMLSLSPTVSGLQHRPVNFESFNLYCNAIFIHPLNERLNLSVGLSYSTITGIPAPIPVAILSWDTPSKKWHFDMGIPRMNIIYKPTRYLEISTSMLMSGEYFHLEEKNTFKIKNDNKEITPEDVKISNLAAGFKCKLKIYKMLNLQADVGYTFRRQYELLNDKKKVYDFNISNNIYTGLKLSLSI